MREALIVSDLLLISPEFDVVDVEGLPVKEDVEKTVSSNFPLKIVSNVKPSERPRPVKRVYSTDGRTDKYE